MTFRIPSLYFLFKSLLLLSIIILQVANLFPSTNSQALRILGDWAGHKEMEDVCWSLFGTVCLALLVGALTRGLEGPHSMNQSPFNIVSVNCCSSHHIEADTNHDRVWIFHAPAHLLSANDPHRPDKAVKTGPERPLDLVLSFATSLFHQYRSAMKPADVI